MKRKPATLDPLQRTRLRHMVAVWGFLVLAVISGVITLQAYRGNSARAKKLYEQLLAADKAGGDVEKALRELRSYTYAHMNTQLGTSTGVYPPIQLKGTYDRLLAAEQSRVEAAKAANANLYSTAQQVCEKQIPDGFSGRGRIPCITDYVTTHTQNTNQQAIPEGLYKFDFVSPAWSPDVAGFGMIITTVLLAVFIYQFIIYRRLKHHLHMSS